MDSANINQEKCNSKINVFMVGQYSQNLALVLKTLGCVLDIQEEVMNVVESNI